MTCRCQSIIFVITATTILTVHTFWNKRHRKSKGVIKRWTFQKNGNLEYTKHRTKTKKKRKTQPQTWNMSNIDSSKQPWNHVLANGKQFLPLIRHPPCYLISQEVLETTIWKQTLDMSPPTTTLAKDKPNIVLCRRRREHHNTEIVCKYIWYDIMLDISIHKQTQTPQ